ncbi:MAG: membrane protein insertase YidC [Candidatus Nanopelagicales bacterium]|nr:membrane protein insertase YidC [Candidatus Nanopelagicales bacterium]
MFIFDWLKNAVSWVLVQFHGLFSSILDADSGWTWTLSIVGLVVTIRIILIPLFVKQIKSQRNLQLIQPQMKEIQKKYAGDREKQSQEMMKLYKETGTNPLASCLPIILQAPIFFALFSVLNGVSQYNPDDKTYVAPGVFAWDQYANLVPSMHDAQIFGVPLYGTFMGADVTPNASATRILCVVMIILMTATTFLTQRQLIVKNSAPDNPMVKQQKILLYVFPIMFMISGINFPIGVLMYWFTTNLWSMGQQFWVIRNNPQPGTPAFDAKVARENAREVRKGGSSATTTLEVTEVDESATPRVQPKKTSRSQRKSK